MISQSINLELNLSTCKSHSVGLAHIAISFLRLSRSQQVTEEIKVIIHKPKVLLVTKL